MSQVDKYEWNGLVRGLLDGKADMVVTSLKITPDRSTAVACVCLYLCSLALLLLLLELACYCCYFKY